MTLDFGKYYIENDGLNWTVFEKKIVQEGPNAGTERGQVCGYYTRLSGALNGLLNCKLHDSDAEVAQELRDDLRAAVEEITEVVRAYFEDTPAASRSKVPSTKVTAERTELENLENSDDGAYFFPKQVLELLPESEYNLLELRRKGRGHTAVVKLHEPARVRDILQAVAGQKGVEPAKVVVARRVLELLR